MNKKIYFSSKDISNRMVARLTEYLRILKEENKTKKTLNSIDLAEKMNSTAAQVRKDLSTFGEFGTRGKGYSIAELIKIIESILGVDEENQLILVGCGKMGSMIASNTDVLGKNFKLVAVFDKDKEKIGKKIDYTDLEIKSIKELKTVVKETEITQAILAVNKEVAQKVTDILLENGIKAILNLTASRLEVPSEICVVDVDISAKLQELNFWRRHVYLKNLD